MKVQVIQGKSGDKKPLKKNWFKLKSKRGKNPFKKYKVKFTCFNCRKPSHIARDCRSKKIINTSKDKGKQISKLEKTTVVIIELNLVGDKVEWWLNIDTKYHIYNI